MFNLKNCFRSYEGLDQAEQIKKIADELVAAGAEVVPSGSKGSFEVTFYIKNGFVFASLIKRTTGEAYYTIFDKDIYDEYLNGKGGITVLQKGTSKMVSRIRLYSGKRQEDLHRLVVKSDGDLKRLCMDVDHIYMNTFINTSEALRPSTKSENSRHKMISLENTLKLVANGEFSSKFLYDSAEDFTNTGYAYVLHKMLGIGTWEDVRGYNIDYINRYDVARADKLRKIGQWIRTNMSCNFANEGWYQAITAFCI